MHTVYGLTDVGQVREGNEDFFLTEPKKHLYVVADGMGAHNAGEVASAMAVEAVDVHLSAERVAGLAGDPKAIEEALSRALIDASKQVLETSRSNPAYQGMGCTIVVALVDGDVLHVCNVGDARAYVSNSGGLRQLSTDHSTAMMLVEAGQMTREEARRSPLSAEVTQAIGAPAPIKPAYRRYSLEPGDKIVLCSDGLWDMLSDTEIQALAKRHKGVKDLCETLVKRANAAGGEDNITVVVLIPVPSSQGR